MNQPMPPNQPPGQQPLAPGQQPQVVYVEAPRKKGKAGKILLGILIGLVALVAGCVALVGSAANEVSQELDASVDRRQADEALVEDTATCELSASANPYWTGKVVFESPLDEEKGFITIEVAFLDSEGSQVDSGSVTFENLSPGQKALGEVTGFSIPEGSTPVECKITDGSIL